MKNDTTPSIALEKEVRTHVPTNIAAFYLNRRPQTLRGWTCCENGPIHPVRVHGRLACSVAKIKELLNE